jgi:ABC-type phosphate transport system permease subunit
MRLNLKALALSAGILWALAVFIVGAANLLWSGYGGAFLKLMASIYPGYHATRSIGDVIVGTLYALFDGAVCGLFFGWIYNLFIGKRAAA